MSTESLPPEIRNLPVQDRLDLVGLLWDSINEESGYQILQWHKDELDRRLEEHARSPNAGKPWDEVKNRLLER